MAQADEAQEAAGGAFDYLQHEARRTSMLDVVSDKLRQQGRNAVLERVVIVARLVGGGERKDISAYYQRFFQQHQREDEYITGLLLVYPKSCLHVVEAPPRVIAAFLRDVADSERTGGLLRDGRVLVLTGDSPLRLFPMWTCRVLPMSSSESGNAPEDIAAAAIDCVKQVLKLGNFLAKVPKHDLKGTLDKLAERVPDFIPSQDAIGAFVDSEKLFPVSRFCDAFYTPVNIVLDNEIVWPMPTRLFPYD